MVLFHKKQARDISNKKREMADDNIDKIVSDSSDLITQEETKRAYDKSLNKVQNQNNGGTLADIETQKTMQTEKNVGKIQADKDYKVKQENDKYELGSMEEKYRQQQKLTDKMLGVGFSLVKTSASSLFSKPKETQSVSKVKRR